MADIVTTRLHVGGITPNISSDHIQDRFASFGTVRDVEALQPDASGQPRTYTFLTIETSSSRLKQCLNTMSGSYWRGTQLRIAEAKPEWDSRIEKESNPDPRVLHAAIAKKRKRSAQIASREGFGKYAQDMRVPTEHNHTTKKFWKLTSSHHLIRPVSMRPSHQLPMLGALESTIRRRRAAPSRARRRVIDPSMWKPTHLSQAAFQDDRSLEDEKAEWEYDDLHGDEDYDDDGQVVIGVWRRMRDGEVIQEDQVRSNRRRPDQFALEVDKGDSYIDLFPSHVRVPPDEKAILPFTDINREASPLFAHRTTPDISFERFPSGSISPQEWPAPVSISTPSSPLFPARKDSSFSPTLSLPVAIGRSHSTVREPFNSLPEIVLKEARAERAVALDLMQAFLGTQDFDSAAKISSTGKRHEWAGFSDGDDDDDDEVPLRLRGGKGSSSQNSTASANSDSEDRDASSLERDDDTDEDDSSDLSDETSSEISETSDDDEPMIISRAEPSNLKSLFAPSSSVTGGFSLLATLDPNLELSDLDIPLAPEPPDNLPEEMAPLEPLAHSSTSKIIFDSDDSVPMFFRSGDEDEGAQGFWRKEDDKEMREIWERDKLMLTREWKRRHRDAKKQRRRRGVMMADDFE